MRSALQVAGMTALSILAPACASLRPPAPPPVVIQAPPHPAEIPQPECLADPPSLTPFAPAPLPPLLPESARATNPVEYWQARARAAEVAALMAIDRTDEVQTALENERARSTRCAQWARDLRAREERRVTATAAPIDASQERK